ncbi:hypothetical protein ACOJUR_08660 [Alicyclobacillus tolerans]|uniref:Uncharacterized protein n=1 Tax=Alicyclobacillus tolerans TaxID=90970 RepID=A0ABT9LZZ3_9BACL|nr:MULTISPECIES: hypothetical protein [Alicyclobacillus]MDP9729823.1 hypothetical protein [Alicyclobacillus tengchongensis]QRF23518.1 hypothetical protein FY534_07435 [Alicyclobacillus sp. TC]
MPKMIRWETDHEVILAYWEQLKSLSPSVRKAVWEETILRGIRAEEKLAERRNKRSQATVKASTPVPSRPISVDEPASTPVTQESAKEKTLPPEDVMDFLKEFR